MPTENVQASRMSPQRKIDKQINEFMKGLIGKTVTAASFSADEGYMIEINHIVRLRSDGSLPVVLKRKVQ